MLLRRAWRGTVNAVRDWVALWPVADVLMPSPSRQLSWHLAVTMLAAVGVAVTHYLFWRFAAQPDLVDSASLAQHTLQSLLLIGAGFVGAMSCRQQLVVQPRSMLIPLVDAALLAAFFVLAATRLDVPAPLAIRWELALVMLLLMSVALLLRLWGALLLSVNVIRMRRMSQRKSRDPWLRGEDDLLVCILEPPTTEPLRVTLRTEDGERGAILEADIVPEVFRRSVSVGAWFRITQGRVDWARGEPRVTSGILHYVGEDPAHAPPRWLSPDTIVGTFALITYHVAIVGLARLLVAIHV